MALQTIEPRGILLIALRTTVQFHSRNDHPMNFNLRPKTHPYTLFALLLAFAFSITTHAKIEAPGANELALTETDWPWWRGPNRNGYALDQQVPTRWNEKENVVWKTAIPGRGHSTPTVVGDGVYLLTSDEEKQTQSILGLDRKSGAVRWITQLHEGGWDGRIHQRNTQASPTLASNGDTLFAVLMHGDSVWLSAVGFDGKILWQKAASDFISHWGYSTSPAIYKNLVIVCADHTEGGSLTAFDQKNGQIVWKTKRPQTPNYASPVIYHLNGKDQIILPGCDMIAGYNPENGDMIWSSPVTTQETVGSAITDCTRVFASGGWPKNETACILADGSGELVWRNSIRTYAPSMLVTGGYVYTMTDKGIAYCWDAETGKTMWREKFGGDFSSSLTLVGDLLYTSSEQGKTLIFKANPKEFQVVAENQLGDEIWTSPVICGNRIYIRTAHHKTDGRQEVLYCIGG